MIKGFDKSENIIDFFESASQKFHPISAPPRLRWCNDLPSNLYYKIRKGLSENASLDKFVSLILENMLKELKAKQNALMIDAKEDWRYFFTASIAGCIAERKEDSGGKDPYFLDRLAKFNSNKRLRRIFQDNYWAYRATHMPLEKHVIAAAEEDVKIFPTPQSPLPSEVRQSNIGDCYLAATLIALAKNNKQAIKNCFTEKQLDKIGSKDKIGIRFFTLAPYESTPKPVVITIDKRRVISPHKIKDGALWPKLIEKAYVVYNQQRLDIKPAQESRYRIDGGHSAKVMFAITGESPANSHKFDYREVKVTYKDKFTPENVIETIKRKLSKSKSLICAFKSDFIITDAKNHEKIKIYKEHAYAIMGIDESRKYIRLINPWKAGGRTYSSPNINRNRMEPKEPVKEDGHIAISFEDFKKHYNCIDYTSKKNENLEEFLKTSNIIR